MVEKTRKRCPYCNYPDTEVINLWTGIDGSAHAVRCLHCGQRGPVAFIQNRNDNVQEMVAVSINLAIDLYNSRYSE